MRHLKLTILAALAALVAVSCAGAQNQPSEPLYDGVVYEMNVRQYTPEGTFDAAREQLPRLKELGVDIVWVMPLYPIGEKGRKGTLGSYYAIRDYCDVNPEFGTLEDFDEFVAEAHSLGLKVIIDWVANHTSPDHPWVTQKPADWYYRDAEGNTIVEYDWTDIAKLNYANPDVHTAMLEAMNFWLERGIDGYRCDMAHLVPAEFWTPTIETLRKKAGRPLYFLAEAQEDWIYSCGFDTMYGWRFHHLLNDIAQGRKGKSELVEEIQKGYLPGEGQLLSFTSNHDENSWAGTEMERMGDAVQALSVLCWTLPHAQPLIYTGQEVGFNHRFEFFEKDINPDWTHNPYTEFYARLASLKHSHPALDTDAAFELLESDDKSIAFRRSKGSDEVSVRVDLAAPWSCEIKCAEDKVEKVEPLCWWTDMKTPLQLLVKGEDISSYEVSIEGGEGVRATLAHKADSPNYLFVDVEISSSAKPGTYYISFDKEGESFRVPYQIYARREGSAQRVSFTTADLMYLIMPDRFVNGDKSNDSTPQTTEKASPKEFFGRHGGDIAGIRSQLPYLEDLGVTAVWNTPLLEDNEPSQSYHGYACTDYYHIDSRFGSNENYREFVADAHSHGIKMIMDVVTNHCGDAHWWMQDLPFEDWVHQWPEYTHSNCCFSVQNDPYAAKIDKTNMEGGWFDRSMVDMNLDNPYLLQYFKQWAVWWIEYADLDGFRVDTYPYNEKYPMSEWCQAVRTEYPNINIVGEVWSNNVPQLAYWQEGMHNKDGFDSRLPSIMDFPLQTAFIQALSYDGRVNWDEGMVKVYDCVANDQYYADKDNMLIFTGNHDQERIADCLGKDPARVKMAFTMLATLRGIPQVLYADELFAVSADRRQGHGGLRVDFPLNWEKNRTAVDMHDYFRTLFQWRKTSRAVQQGELTHFLRRDNTYAYFRYLPDFSDVVFVFVNSQSSPVEIPWADYAEITSRLPEGGKWVNVIDNKNINPEKYTINEKQSIVLHYSVEPRGI